MRVLIYIGDAQWTGSSRALLAAARGLASREHAVTLACCSGSRLGREAREAGVETVAIDGTSSTAGGAWDLRRVIKEKFIEVVLVGSERDQLVVSSARLFADRGAVLRRVHSFESLELLRTGRLALRMAASGVIVSTEVEKQTVNTAGWTIPAAVAPLGVDASTFDAIEPASPKELKAPRDRTLIACSYDESARYRIATIFRTLALLGPRHTSLHVVVFGPGSLDEGLRLHASALGVGSLVSFIGETDDNRRVMRAASAGWIVSGGDNAVFACLDFMALRVPVLAERSPLTQHYLADHITGKLLTSGDPAYTASSVAAFLGSQETLTAMGNAGRARVQREFSETMMVDGFEQAVNAAGDRTKWTKRK
ncbi:MAG TPA: glycosyltransferase [Gemmatimonadaceae bacterium]|jgi:glycosyltransferase involved in cell wall biosynthesis